jgi:hypothetical protein
MSRLFAVPTVPILTAPEHSDGDGVAGAARSGGRGRLRTMMGQARHLHEAIHVLRRYIDYIVCFVSGTGH